MHPEPSLLGAVSYRAQLAMHFPVAGIKSYAGMGKGKAAATVSNSDTHGPVTLHFVAIPGFMSVRIPHFLRHSTFLEINMGPPYDFDWDSLPLYKRALVSTVLFLNSAPFKVAACGALALGLSMAAWGRLHTEFEDTASKLPGCRTVSPYDPGVHADTNDG